jgi:Lrp/AsnC family transcriptional regulator, leucine-responsive regulatory protein
MKALDPMDVDILTILQVDGRASMAEIGEEIGLSASAVLDEYQLAGALRAAMVAAAIT